MGPRRPNGRVRVVRGGALWRVARCVLDGSSSLTVSSLAVSLPVSVSASRETASGDIPAFTGQEDYIGGGHA